MGDSRHVPDPELIRLTVNDQVMHLPRRQAKLLASADQDGWIRSSSHGFGEELPIPSMRRHGWVLRSRNRWRLTPAGMQVRAALLEYLARKKQALNNSGDS